MARRDMLDIEGSHAASSSDGAGALYHLGVMHCNGRSSEPDLVAAHKWFNLAALRGHEQALQYRTEIAREMTNEEISAAQREARKWMLTH